MYPLNEELELFGETVTWPNVDEDGKFTNGSFSDPSKKPSFIPAKTVNLILDNLSELLVVLGKTPDNKDGNQLATAVTEALETENRDREAADAVLSEAVALKANIASPALTGTPTAPTAAAKNNSTQIATTAYADRAGHPVNSYYTQYPVTGEATLAGMFPSTKSPATLFGGTWTERFIGEEVFFKTAPATVEANRGKTYNTSTQEWSGAGTAGIQGDAERRLNGCLGFTGSEPPHHSGPFYKGVDVYTLVGAPSALFNDSYMDNARMVPTDTTNHPKNRLIKVWERTA
jgi:hypothetical protein